MNTSLRMLKAAMPPLRIIGIIFWIGCTPAPATRQVLPTPSSTTSTTLTDRHYLEINRVIGREALHGIAGAQLAKAQGFTNVYIISQKLTTP